MLITNQTIQEYYFGPLHLPAGIGTGTLTVDDTSATSLYLTDDGVADAINALYSTGKITVSSAAVPFPRPTGDPQVLHGDGAPEGLIYAGQGSMYMSRTAASNVNFLFTKTTGVHLNTGWVALNPGGTVGATVAQSVSGLGTGYAGAQGFLRLGSSPWGPELAVTYDALKGKWISSPLCVIQQDGTRATGNWGYQETGRGHFPYKELRDAGLDIEARGIGENVSNQSNAYAQWQINFASGTKDAALGGFTNLYNSAYTSSTSWLLRDSGWVPNAGVASADIGCLAIYTQADNTGQNQTSRFNLYIRAVG